MVLAAIGASVNEPEMSEQMQSRGSGDMSCHGTSLMRNSEVGPFECSQCQRPERFCTFWQCRPPNRARVRVSLNMKVKWFQIFVLHIRECVMYSELLKLSQLPDSFIRIRFEPYHT